MLPHESLFRALSESHCFMLVVMLIIFCALSLYTEAKRDGSDEGD